MKEPFEIVGIILCTITLIAIEVFLATWLWNDIVVFLFDFPSITPSNMLGLMVLLNIIIPHGSNSVKD